MFKSDRFGCVQLLCTVAAGEYTPYGPPCASSRGGAVDGGGGDVAALGRPAGSALHALGSVTGYLQLGGRAPPLFAAIVAHEEPTQHFAYVLPTWRKEKAIS